MFKTLPILASLLLAPFQLLSAQHDFTEIDVQARLSAIAYLNADGVKSGLESQSKVLVHHSMIEENQVSYFLTQSNGVQTIVIRGTANEANVMLDLDLELKPDTQLNIKLHQGFASAARAVLNDVKPYLNADQPVHLTGHSLGGAVAVVLGMYLEKNDFNVAQVITFGQPKVTNVAGAELFASLPLLRIVTPDDIVPLVPPISPLQIRDLDIYWHMGVGVILDGNGKYSEVSGVKSALRATKFTSSVPGQKNINAHMMTEYIRLIEQLKISAQEIPYETGISLFGLSIN
ncbi:hypothetical protein GCM10008107_14180 [Psychrosphaera saromensis]|uniref:Lipase n=1 Tax=Psychrosphaera saromensis TaxID=716813 RepID=A0A2S7UVR1_9GAMM|nr:lipase family protein [Psychrosphaera saromensis]PQJ53350.1 lipase [Psychrosphaera saromensis]GHB66202.1 hypothetical protein GCM10008107_14180 [Psychrosphaera saromensis]GLQ14874.1 hypothetical protein GCM10007917_23290 [Psychrosphaera saromensis]